MPESGSNVVDGILRIRGTFYAKEYVTVITKKRILQDLCYDDNFDVLCTKLCITCHSLHSFLIGLDWIRFHSTLIYLISFYIITYLYR